VRGRGNAVYIYTRQPTAETQLSDVPKCGAHGVPEIFANTPGIISIHYSIGNVAVVSLEGSRTAGEKVGWVRDGAIIPGGCCDSAVRRPIMRHYLRVRIR